MRSGAGAEIIFIKQEVWTLEDARIKKNAFSTATGMVLLLINIKWHFMAGAGAEIWDKGGAGVGAQNK